MLSLHKNKCLMDKFIIVHALNDKCISISVLGEENKYGESMSGT